MDKIEGILGHFNPAWSLRQAKVALDAWQEQRWDQIAWQLCVIVNNLPHFGKGPRRRIPLWRFNPLAKRPPISDAERAAGFEAAWEIGDEGNIPLVLTEESDGSESERN